MIAAPVKTKGGGGALLPAVLGDLRPRALRFYRGPPAETDPGEMPAQHAAGRPGGRCRGARGSAGDCVRFSERAPPAEESRLTRRDFRGCSAADRAEIVAEIATNGAARGAARAPGRRSRLRTRADGPRTWVRFVRNLFARLRVRRFGGLRDGHILRSWQRLPVWRLSLSGAHSFSGVHLGYTRNKKGLTVIS